MGVPALFRWLSRKYPKIVSPAVEEQPQELNGIRIPVDISKPNPNEQEFDNFYLDMNNLVHPCCHPEGKPAPDTEEDMMVEIFKYLDRVVSIVRPRKVLYMAIDGVAPRAKMNQQRSRRFRAAQEAKEKADEEAKLLAERQEATGQELSADTKQKFDSNCITPGTPFMTLLTQSIRYYVAKKLNNDPSWKNLKVIISDANVPGEGEHKIMNFIRSQRNSPNYDPNTRHVMYGLDADLIMLSLATHEPHFTLLREDVFAGEGDSNACFICGQSGHIAARCTGSPADKIALRAQKQLVDDKPFVLLHINVLREYLEIELRREGAGFEYDFERAIDDWVFICFFVGNDFLPHLPSLEIREGALDSLVSIWKRVLPLMGGFVTQDGFINLERAQYLLTELGRLEDKTFQDRRQREERRILAAKRRKLQSQDYTPPRRATPMAADDAPMFLPNTQAPRANAFRGDIASFDNQSAAQKLKAALSGSDESHAALPTEATPSSVEQHAQHSPHVGEKRKLENATEDMASDVTLPGGTVNVSAEDEADGEPVDTVRFWESGFKERYYRQKFGVELCDTAFRRQIVLKYVEGLCWVLRYYYQGCPSWKWYYPYHYAPFASDFVDVFEFDIRFELGSPFRPVEQLMGVLPAASRSHIPEPFHRLMTQQDSEIIDFYPVDFDLDMNGKKHLWQAVILLPFIDEQRLLGAMAPIYPELSDDEVLRNSPGEEQLLVSKRNQLYDCLCELYSKDRNEAAELDMITGKGISGVVGQVGDFVPETSVASPFKQLPYPDLVNNRAMIVTYRMPPLVDEDHYHSRTLPGARPDPKVLSRDDVEFVLSGAADRGRGRGRGRGFSSRGGSSSNRGAPHYGASYSNNAGYGRAPGHMSNNYYGNPNGGRPRDIAGGAPGISAAGYHSQPGQPHMHGYGVQPHYASQQRAMPYRAPVHGGPPAQPYAAPPAAHARPHDPYFGFGNGQSRGGRGGRGGRYPRRY